MLGHFARRGRIVAFGVLLCAAGLPALAGASTPRVVVAGAHAVPVADRVVSRVIETSFDVVLNQSHPRELASFLAAITDPSSPDYRHFLTTAQFAARYGASRASVAALSTYLAGFGLRVGALSKGRVVLAVRGTTTQIGAAFATRVVTVRTASGQLRAQFLSPASLPASLARAVHGVAGLSSVTSPSPAHLTTRAARLGANVTLPGTCPQAGSSSGTTPNSLGGYTISQQAQLYGLNTQWAAGNTGAGQTIGIYELEPYATADLTTYFKCYGLAPDITNVSVDGGSSDPNGLEATLDIEEAAALAPGAAIQVYTGPNNNTGPTDVLTHMADDNTASIISTSWGLCETDPSNDPTAEQPIFEQMAAQGQTVVAAAGDSGSSDCVNGQDPSTFAPAVDDPASQPFVTGVGGLTVSNINPLAQTVWNEGLGYNNFGAGGGGISKLWSRPSWQSAPGITAGQTMRLVPDLSVMADPSTGFIAYFTGSETGVCSANCSSPWGGIGGTSIGAPLVSAMAAVAAQACAVTRLGFINPSLYAMDRANRGFVDVTTGNNDLLNTGSYSAGVGFDEASGLGSPDPSTFYAGLCPATLSTTASSLIPTKTSATVGDRKSVV
jgi:subtilase family serine protease